MRAVAALVALWLSLSLHTALAHPLGNFTVNHYSRVELTGNTLRVRYVLDLAEIPSVQEARAADVTSDAYKVQKATDIMRQLDLTIDNEPVPLQLSEVAVTQPVGQGDIALVRLEAWYSAAREIAPNVSHQAVLRDRNDAARIGWREMVVHSGPGATLSNSSVPSQDVSDELRNYPDDMLQNPLDRREADWSFTLDGSTATAGEKLTAAAPARAADPFAALVTAADLNPAVILLALIAAASLGGIHAASPGHGKSIMAAYLVGTHGTALQAAFLAMSVTVSHTAGVLVLGILTVLASNLIVPEQLYPWLTLISGAVVLVMGVRFWWMASRGRAVEDHHHDHAHPHDHHHHAPPVAPTWRSLFALGLSGGLVPSGSALVVLLSSIALGRLGFGLVLIVAFGVGMAAVLVTTGVLLVHAGRLMLRWLPQESPLASRLTAGVPLLSATIMTLLGVVATYDGLAQIGAMRLT